METICFAIALVLGLVAVPFLDRTFARNFEPENRDITWPRTIAVSAVAFVGGLVLSVPVVLCVPSALGRIALLFVIAIAVRGNALKRIYHMDTAAAFGSAVLVVFSIIVASFASGLVVVAFLALPVVSTVVTAVAALAWYLVHRQSVAVRRALGAA